VAAELEPLIRAETRDDVAAIAALHRAAFGRPNEADLVARLRRTVQPLVSLVALVGEQVVGHILFSPVTIDAAPAALRPMGLAPMAVLPILQRRGIGSALVRVGIDACRAAGAGAVVVLGHPTYYPRFGFVPAIRFGLCSEYDVAEDVFMAWELTPGSLAGIGGVVRYPPAFAEL
jgi:putative acetyltransferase